VFDAKEGGGERGTILDCISAGTYELNLLGVTSSSDARVLHRHRARIWCPVRKSINLYSNIYKSINEGYNDVVATETI
jgi:hypothetical protein